MNRAVRKYQRTTRGRRLMRLRVKKWRALNRFNRDTITMFKPFAECELCPEDPFNCPVEANSEDIRICRAWQEFKRTGIHPSQQQPLAEPEYDPDNIDFLYNHDEYFPEVDK